MFAVLERWFRHAAYELRDGFLLRPLAMALGIGLFGIVLPLLEERVPGVHRLVEGIPVLVPRDPTAASSILGSILGSMMTILSIVLSVLLIALTFASIQFSPRILTAFIEDRTSQRTIGVFLGTFVYCLFVYPSVRSAPPSTPALAVLGAILLAIACTVALVAWVHHIARSINPSFISDRIAIETERVVDKAMPNPRGGTSTLHEQPPPAFERSAVIRSTRSGYIRFVDIPRLRSLAKSTGVAIRLERRVGEYTSEGVPLLCMSRNAEITEAERSAILETIDVGPMRTLEQDIDFGLLQVVDIALKAISPAVNDPSTAINCIDHLSRLLVRIVGRELPPRIFFEPPGVVRLVLPAATLERFLDTAFDQIVHYGRSDVAVSLRIQRAFGDIASATDNPDVRSIVLGRARKAMEAAAAVLPADGAERVRLRFETTADAMLLDRDR